MSETLHVLLVEDSATDAKLVLQALWRPDRPVEHQRVETAEAMREALAVRPWDIVISDWSMPQFSARAALGVLTAARLDLPFVIVSGTVGEEAAVEAMRAGAQDYVLKDRLGRLAPVVERELRERRERMARREAEALLRVSEGRFRRLADSGVIGIVTSDMNGPILDANDCYLKMIGYTREQLKRGEVRWTDLTPPELAHLGARAAQQLRETGVAPPWETETFHKDGSRVPVLVGVAMVEYPEAIAFIVDLSERRRAEAARLLAEKALRESEGQLRQSQKMEAVGRLAGGVAHDFNNVLSVILSYADFIFDDLEARRPNSRRHRRDPESRHASRRAHAPAPDAEPAAGRRTEDRGPARRAGGHGKMLRRILGEDVELVVVAPASEARVRVDPTHVEQIILNLVVNARDAMPTGGKKLTIETASVDLDEAYVNGHLPAKAGAPRRARGDRHRRRHGRSDAGAHLRAVFHDQGDRQRNGPRALDGLWDRPAERGHHLGLQRAGQGNRRSRCTCRASTLKSMPPGAPAPPPPSAGPRRSCWSKTRTR